MSNIHFIGGEKGGVGKSLVSRVLAQFFIDKQLPFIGFDTDRSHGSLLRFYTDYASPLVIDDYTNLDRIVEAATENPDRRILVDLAAQTHQNLVRWIEDSGLLELSGELGITLKYWHVMDAGRDSVDLLRQLLDRFGSQIELIVVRNEIRGDRFEILDTSGQLKRAEDLGAKVISIRKLQDTTMQKIDAHNTSFWAAVQRGSTGDNGLGLLERQRVKVWLNKAYDEIDKLGV